MEHESTPILTTKLYIPPLQPHIVLRPRLIKRLNEGLRRNQQSFGRKLTLISAPAGFGKTTLVSEWVAGCERFEPPVHVAWLSLDKGDNDPIRFLAYLVAALQRMAARQPAFKHVGQGVMSLLQSPQPPPPELMLTTLINDITTVPDNFLLVLDDYHVIDTRAVNASTSVEGALTFLLKHLPPQMHLVIATREDPALPLARLRGRGHLTELRAADLRFTPDEAAEFLNQAMGFNLSADEIAALESRTEGWIAGLQLAALALQGTIALRGMQDTTSFIVSFAGSYHFVLDYLVEEVLHQQPEHVQAFLLRTSILERLCGPLCDAVCAVDIIRPSDGRASGQDILEYLERANLFIVPLDNERHWYRYHHLFAEFLRQRLYQKIASSREKTVSAAELHIRASQWHEDHDLELEAFQHAVAANDTERAARLLEGKGMPLQFRGAVAPVLNWLASLPTTALDARPSLWVMYASALSMTGQMAGVEEKLQAAEAALQRGQQSAEPDDRTRDLIGHIAAIRALLAATQYQTDAIIAQSRRALEYLRPDNLPVRTATIWKLGIAYQLRGERAAARQAYADAIATSQASGNMIINVAATIGLGNIQEADNQLYLADQTYRHALRLVGEPPRPAASGAYLGLARIRYQWNDLQAAQLHGQQSLHLAQQIEIIDNLVACEVFLARLKLTQGDMAGASTLLAEADQCARHHNFAYRMPEIVAAQVLVFLHQGNLAAAAQLAETHDLAISQARVFLAQGDPAAALTALEPARQQMEAKGWRDEQLKIIVLQAVALDVYGEAERALRVLGEALALAEPGGFMRLFVDEGLSMVHLLSEAAVQGRMPDYIGKLLAAFDAERQKREGFSYVRSARPVQPLIDLLSERELEVLQLIARGLSNREIGERLFLALSTVKGHNQKIFGKLGVQRRTEAVARARELGLL